MSTKHSCRVFLVAVLPLLSACTNQSALEIPELKVEPKIVRAGARDLSEYAPGYGISVSAGAFEVNIEAEDAAKVRPGQSATVTLTPRKGEIPCRVSRVIRNASSETGQAIAWLDGAGAPVGPGRFATAKIRIGIKRGVIALPEKAIFIREGKTWVVIRTLVTETGKGKEPARFAPVAVQVGSTSGELVPILSGVKIGDEVVVEDGIGYLYPDFKAAGEGG